MTDDKLRTKLNTVEQLVKCSDESHRQEKSLKNHRETFTSNTRTTYYATETLRDTDLMLIISLVWQYTRTMFLNSYSMMDLQGFRQRL